MRMDIRELRGRPVVALSEADTLGRVADALFETSPFRVVALRLDGDGPESVVPFDRIRSVGADAVTIEDATAAESGRRLSAFRDLPGIDALTRLKIVDENGTYLGDVETIDVDGETGRVVRLGTHKGGVLGLGVERRMLSADAIRRVGAEVITVVAPA
jgi:uncharacterized protein YrrD